MKLRELNSKLMIIIIATLVLAIVGVGFIIFGNKKMSQIEINEIKNVSEKYMPYLNYYVDEKEQNVGYVTYAINYFYEEEDKSEVEFKEIKSLVKKVFGVSLSNKDLQGVGLTTTMIESGINYNPGSDIYTINIKRSMPELAKKEIIKYNQVKAVKKNKDTYVVTYDRYTVDKPYELMNYYKDAATNEKTTEKEAKTNNEIADKILEYLKAKAKVGTIVNYINEDNIKRCGKVEKGLTITYKSTSDGLVINKIK